MKEEELHGIVTDFKYSIENYANVFCKRASQKLYTLERVSAFVTSQFEYLHVVLDVFYCRNLNNKILPLHKWVLEETITQFQIIIEIGRPYGKKRVNENQHSVIFTQCGSEPISFLGPKIWDIVPSDIKRCKSLNGFKTEVEKRISEGFLCSLCKVYLRQKELARPKIKNKNSKTYHGIFTVEADKHCYHYHILIFMSLNQIQIPMHV